MKRKNLTNNLQGKFVNNNNNKKITTFDHRQPQQTGILLKNAISPFPENELNIQMWAQDPPALP